MTLLNNSDSQSNLHQVILNYRVISILTCLFIAWILLYIDIYFLSKLGIIFFVFISLLFVESLGKTFPVKELIGFMFFFQLILAPSMVYNYLDNETTYLMEIEESEYMSFAFYGAFACILGLFLRISSKKHNVIQLIKNLKTQNDNYQKIGITLIIIGVLALFTTPFVHSSLKFVFYLLSGFRFIGLFYIMFSKNKYKPLWILGIYGEFTYEIIGQGVFSRLFEWGTFLFIILTLAYKFKFIIKLAMFLGMFFLMFFVQSFKEEYREVVWRGGGEKGIIAPVGKQEETRQEVFKDMVTKRVEGSKELYSYSNFNKFISRFNQGWIFTKVLKHVPAKEPFCDGEVFLNELRAFIVPRFLDPDKPTSGGEYGREKFFRFTGKVIKDTRMTIGTFGDAYVNFGFVGGIVYMFAFGLLLNLGLNYVYSLSVLYPSLLLWIPFIFLSAMRAGSETLVIFNHITKSSFVVFLVFMIYKKYFKIKPILTEVNEAT